VPVLAVYPRLLPAQAAVRTDHLQERFGQLILIVMGDALLETVLNVERGSTLSLPGLFFAVLVMMLLWRAYFLHVLPTGPPMSLRRLQSWTAAHLVIVLGVGFSAAGVAAAASPLTEEALAEFEILSEHVPLGVIVGIGYLGFAWAALLSSSPSRRAVVVLAVGGAVTILGSVLLEVLDSGILGTALLILLALVATDAGLVGRSRQPLPSS
jgi:low temperature requirement protein LtrA